MSPNTIEVRAFLAGVAGHAVAPSQIPQALRVLVRGAAGGRFHPDDLLQDLLADLLARSRNAQPSGIAELLKLQDVQLVAALRRRVVQVRAVQLGSRARLVKVLRAHVAAALEQRLPTPDVMPMTLVVGDRISRDLVRQAVAYVLAQVDPPEREPRALAAQFLAEYFTVGAEEIGLERHGEPGDHEEDRALLHVDAGGHLRKLRQLLGPELARVLGLRAQGKSLAEIANGRMGVSTIHDHQAKALRRVREHVRHHGLVRADLEPVLEALAA